MTERNTKILALLLGHDIDFSHLTGTFIVKDAFAKDLRVPPAEVERALLGADVISYSPIGSSIVASTMSELTKESFAEQVVNQLRISCSSTGNTRALQLQKSCIMP